MKTGNRTASKADRGPNFYASPYAALPPLLVAERRYLPKTIWEPFCGNGALVLPLRNRGFDVTATDLYEWGCPDATASIDFHEAVAEQHAPAGPFGIVSNPPFDDLERLIELSVRRAPYAAFLLRLAFLESEGRMDWFKTVRLQRVHVIAERLPMMHRWGWDGAKLDKAGLCFAWYVFERDKRPRNWVPLRWVSWKRSAMQFPMRDEDVPPAAKEGRRGLFEM
jgi:hypothetical protein